MRRRAVSASLITGALRARGRANQMPARISAPPRTWIVVSLSPRMIQPKAAAATASRKMTSDEKTAGSRPRAIDSRPWPPAWLIHAMAISASDPLARARQDAVVEEERDDEQDGGRDQGQLERHPRRRRRPRAPAPRPGSRVAKKTAVADAVEVADDARRVDAEALRR